jgi:hypothetical protein
MDIHKPKPWRGVREFLKEYVIVVVGVLTALGAEQLAEAFHWRHEVEIEREALLREARDNVSTAAYRQSLASNVPSRGRRSGPPRPAAGT